MGWYLNEDFLHFIKMPQTYSRCICATCWKNEVDKMSGEEAKNDVRIRDLIYLKEDKHFITQKEFDEEHQGHILAFIDIEGQWFPWQPLVYCEQCNDFTEIYVCEHKRGGPENGRNTYHDPCKTCFIIKSDFPRVCSCAKSLLRNKTGPRFLNLDDNGIQLDDCWFFCTNCDKFISEKEKETAIDFGPPSCLNASECSDSDCVHLYHYAKHHNNERDRINLGYEAGTLVSHLRREYGLNKKNRKSEIY